MPLPPTTAPPGDETPVRGRDDACPGALRLHSADDGALARVRLPAGRLTARQALVLALAAEELGDGRLDLTSRGNLQLRGLDAGCGAGLAARLRTAGLLPSDRHDRVRNIVASPLSGLDGAGYADVSAWARELDALLCDSAPAGSGLAELAGLSGRFLFALDDGRGDVAALGADVTLVAAPDGEAVLRLGSAGGHEPAGPDARPAPAGARVAGSRGGADAHGAATVPTRRDRRTEGGGDTRDPARPYAHPGPPGDPRTTAWNPPPGGAAGRRGSSSGCSPRTCRARPPWPPRRFSTRCARVARGPGAFASCRRDTPLRRTGWPGDSPKRRSEPRASVLSRRSSRREHQRPTRRENRAAASPLSWPAPRTADPRQRSETRRASRARRAREAGSRPPGPPRRTSPSRSEPRGAKRRMRRRRRKAW
ncbi:hypothetical protein ACWDSL_41915 [Streptomyces sp. NPDC000941]